jgi:hypothetical protein
MLFQRIFSAVKRHKGSGDASQKIVEAELIIRTHTLSQLNRRRINASRYLPGDKVGQRSSVRRKPAIDFREHRMYVPGDDIRYVDWKASARQEHIFIKQGEYQKKINIYILIDCSASMGWGTEAKSVTALSLAAALGYSALAHGDRLSVVPLIEKVTLADAQKKTSLPFGPISGKGQFPGLLNYLHSLSFHGTFDLNNLIHDFIIHTASGSGLVLLISDLLNNTPGSGAGLGPALNYLPIPTWNVVVFHLLHPEELKPTLHGEFEFYDIETRVTSNYDVNPKVLQVYQQRMRTWREGIEFECNENNGLYTLIQSDWSLDTEILPLLRDLNVLVPV